MAYVTKARAADGHFRVIVAGRPVTETRETRQATMLVRAIRRLRSLKKAKTRHRGVSLFGGLDLGWRAPAGAAGSAQASASNRGSGAVPERANAAAMT